MDIPQVLAVLRPGEDWGPCAQSDSAYSDLAATWRSPVSAVPTLQQMTDAWNTIVSGAPVALEAQRQSDAAGLFGDPGPTGRLQRAAALVVLDRVNELREWLVSFKAAVAAATSLANLQVRVAALPDMPDYTANQIKTAIQNKINNSASD